MFCALRADSLHHLDKLQQNYIVTIIRKHIYRWVLALAGTCFFVVPAQAQRIIGALESNTDMNMVPDADSLSASKKKEKKIVPVDVRSWVIDPLYGDRQEVDVDTLRHLFQNADHNEGMTGHYNSLSNMGSPRQSRLYMERSTPVYLFLQPFDQFYVPTEAFRFYNTKSPYMNLTYQWAGSRTSGDDHFQAVYTRNAGKRFNFGGLYHYIYGKGYYDHQATSFMNGTYWMSYLGDRYDFHFYYTHNFMKMGENGGIADDRYITNPEDQPQRYASNDIPTRLSSTWNRQEHDIVYFNQRYHVGFTRTDSDSVRGVHDTFVPVTTFFHTLQVGSFRKNYKSYEDPLGTYYAQKYMPGDSTNVRDKMMQIDNYFGLTLHEGFNRYAVAGLSAYVGFKHRRFNMPDVEVSSSGDSLQTRYKYSISDVVVGGRISRTRGRYLHYNAGAEFVVAGDDAAEFNAYAHGELNIPVLADTARLSVDATLSSMNPDDYFEHYHSKYAWWDMNASKETRSRIEAALEYPRTHTTLRFGVENVKNFSYLVNEATPVYATDGTVENYLQHVTSRQCSDNVQVLSATLQQNFRLGILHLDNEVTWQTSSNKDVLPLPTLNLYHNLYIDFMVAHVLHCELGADLTYFSQYYAPDYSPAVGLFVNQTSSNKMKIGNYPLVSAYANLQLKRTRFYVQYYHANQSSGHSFWAPHYPMNPSGVRFGISWNFYD